MTFKYWDYFLSIESDLVDCARYVDFSSGNYKTHSVEFARIIMAASAEVDTIAKDLCKLINPAEKPPKKICGYAKILLEKYSAIPEIQIKLDRYNIVITPWEGWSASDEQSSPKWWKGYNDIKHDRTSHFSEANLENAIHSVGGLLLMILYYYKQKGSGENMEIKYSYAPQLFDIVEKQNSGFTEGGFFWGYHLPD